MQVGESNADSKLLPETIPKYVTKVFSSAHLWFLGAFVWWAGTVPTTYLTVLGLLSEVVRKKEEMLALVLGADVAYLLASLLTIAIGRSYGHHRHDNLAPYPGAFISKEGHASLPSGFPQYLVFAGAAAFGVPLIAFIYLIILGEFFWATILFIPYLLIFSVQTSLECLPPLQNFTSPASSVMFISYRFWQFARSLWVIKLFHGTKDAAPSWTVPCLLFELGFWIFDAGVVILFLPWMYNWQLQTPVKRAEKSGKAE